MGAALILRRQTKAERRAAYHENQVKAAQTGAQALDAAWNALLAALARLDDQNPAKADAARRSLADQFMAFARDADPRR